MTDETRTRIDAGLCALSVFVRAREQSRLREEIGEGLQRLVQREKAVDELLLEVEP